MTTAGFHEAVAALSTVPAPSADPRTPSRVTVFGSGVEGRVLAAWFLAEGAEEVRLFTVYSDEVTALGAGSITLRGDGPIGTFRVDGDRPSIEVTSVLDTAVAAADLVVITGPVLKIRTYGLVLGPHLVDGQTVLVAPGRTFGALEVEHLLRGAGCGADISVVEMPGFPFDIVDGGSSIRLTRRRGVRGGVKPHQRTSLIERLRGYLPDLNGSATVLESSFSDGSALVELPALLLGGPAAADHPPAIPPGAHPVASPAFRSLVGIRHEAMIDDLATERRAVAAGFGVRDLPETSQWIDAVAGGVEPGTVRAIPEAGEADQLVRDGVLGSLVPLMSAADIAGVPVPATRSLVTIAEATLRADLRSLGRSLASIGFADLDATGVRARISMGGGRP